VSVASTGGWALFQNLICAEISLRHQNWNGAVDPDQWETKFDTSFDTTTLGKLILTRPLNRPFITLGALIVSHTISVLDTKK
jgi:hypothetical protein